MSMKKMNGGARSIDGTRSKMRDAKTKPGRTAGRSKSKRTSRK